MNATVKKVEIPSSLTVRELATLISVSPIDVIKELMNNGFMANINQVVDYDTAAIVAQEMGFEPQEVVVQAEPEPAAEQGPATLWQRLYAGEDAAKLKPRPPVVTVMGHVDHGKTSLLDAVRHSDVAGGEAGGITQRIGAYQVEHHGRKITFLDTPGHEAFTAMRARGAQATDLAVLVVAADDGVMPQTLEAIAHAKAARVPIVVALNKIDKPNANPERVKKELADNGLLIDEYGGDVLCVPVSAKKNENLDDLLEAILLVADSIQIKANPDRPAVGTVIESKMDKSRGPMATLLVQNGTLELGNAISVGVAYGRVRAMFDERGLPVQKAGPSIPVEVLGLTSVPSAGDTFEVVKNEKIARTIAAERLSAAHAAAVSGPVRPVTLSDLYAQIQAGKIKELALIIKADGQGSIEPIVNSLQKLGDEKVKVNILHAGTGDISENDVALAAASTGIVIGFNVIVDAAARKMAETTGVDVRLYNIIYKLVEDVDKALKGMLEPVYADKVVGHAEVRQVFKIRGVGFVAGCTVREGTALRDASGRVRRGEDIIFDGSVHSLKHLQEDVKEVRTGLDCGVALEEFTDFKEGDIIEFYVKERVS
jgi:translation initiation factor IF-2